MKEAHFLTEWRESLEHWYEGCHAFKIPDQPRFGGEMIKFAVPRPYDMFCVYKGLFVAFEAKMMKTLTAFSFDKLADNQKTYLQKVKIAGGKAYVVINYRVPLVPEKTKKKYGIVMNRYSKVFMFDIDKFLYLEKEASGNSLPFDIVVNEGIQIERENGYWNVSECAEMWGFNA